MQLYVLIRPLYQLIHDLISKELTGCSERIVSIKHRRQIWGAMIVKIVNMQRLEIGQLLWLRGWFFSNPVQWNVISSRLNKIYIIGSTIGRHS